MPTMDNHWWWWWWWRETMPKGHTDTQIHSSLRSSSTWWMTDVVWLAWLKVDEDEAGDEVVSICISYYYNSPHRSMHITLVIHSFRPPQPGHRYLWTVRSIDHSLSGHSFFLTWSGARGNLAIRSGEIHKFLEIKWKWGRELSRSFRTS